MKTGSAYAHLNPVVQTLDNGLTVTMERLPHVHSASAGIWIKTGSGNEREEHAGVSHFLEHLFFKGTETRSARELMAAIESKGGHMNAFTTRDYTCFYVRALDTHIGAAIEILADIVKNSTFCDLDKERNIILEEIASTIDVPEEYAHDLLTSRIWPDQAIGRPIMGSVESVSRLGLDEVRAYRDAWYQPGNMYFSIAGNFDEQAVLRQVREELGTIAPDPVDQRTIQVGFSAGMETFERDIAQDHLVFAFPGPAITDPRRYTYDLLSNVLGGGATSRLFDSVREEAGLAYSIYSFHTGYYDTGMIGVYAAIAPDNLQAAVELSFKEVKKLREAPVDQDELKSNAEQLKGGLLMALESTFNRMARMVRSTIYFERIIPIEEILSGVDAITPQDIHRLAQEIFTEDQCAMTILGPRNGRPVELAL